LYFFKIVKSSKLKIQNFSALLLENFVQFVNKYHNFEYLSVSGIRLFYNSNSDDNMMDHGVGVGAAVTGEVAGIGVSAGYSVGARVSVGYNKKAQNIGGKVVAPVGTLGIKVGGCTEICLAFCVTIKITNDAQC